jgi:CTP synthase
LKPGTIVSKLYNNAATVYERHRHRYEVNPKYHKILQDSGMVFSGVSPDNRLVEFIELSDHPFFTATQAHPEFKSRPLKPAPLFKGFIEVCMKKR